MNDRIAIRVILSANALTKEHNVTRDVIRPP
jgi:hypothetical protein